MLTLPIQVWREQVTGGAMHGLINRAIQCFVRDSYGEEAWLGVIRKVDLEFVEFEAMLFYPDEMTGNVLDAVAGHLKRPRAEVLEDIGTYLVSHRNMDTIARLLRFGGVEFVDFLHSLDELADRVQLAVPDLRLPAMQLRNHNLRRYSLSCECPIEGYANFVVGILRGMADAYGALAVFDISAAGQSKATIDIDLVEIEFAAGRTFELGATNA